MDYPPIEAFLVGRCGKTLREAAMTSVHEYNILVEGHNRKAQEEWEIRRWEVFMQWSVNPNLKKRPHTPQDIVRFPWEREQVKEVNVEPLTEDEIGRLCDIFKIERNNISNGQDK